MSEETKNLGLEETQVIESTEAQAADAAPEKGWKALSKNAKIGISVGAVAVVAAAVVGICVWANQPATLPADEPVEKALVAETEEGASQKVKIGYEGYEAAEGDTPVIAHITGTADGNRSVDYYHAVSGAQEDVELVPGGYSIEYLPVLKAGGSLVTAKDGAVSAVVEDGALVSTSKTNEKAAEDVTQDDLDNVLEAVKKAVEKGDDTLKGDAGKDVVDKVAEAVKATGKVDESKVEEAKKDAETKASEPSAGSNAGQPAATTGSNGNSGSNGGSADKAPASQPASTPSASQPSGNGSSQGGTSQPEQPSAPAHVHNWQPVYSTIVDQEAYTSHEPVGSYILCNCGATFSSQSEWSAHAQAAGRGQNHGYSVQTKYSDVYHPAVTHQEITGYTCSCGATK